MREQVFITLLICLVAVGCSGSPETTSTADVPQAADTPQTEAVTAGGVELNLEEPVIEAGRLLLQGTMTLPDGALLTYAVKHDSHDSGDYDGFEEGHIEVSGGQFSHLVSVDDWPSGHALTRLVFQMNLSGSAQQPDLVVQEYGENGERLEGPDVRDFGGRKTIELSGTTPIS